MTKRTQTEFQEVQDYLQNQIVNKQKSGASAKNEELFKTEFNGLLAYPYIAEGDKEKNAVDLQKYWDSMYDYIHGRTKYPAGDTQVFNWARLKKHILSLPLAKEVITDLLSAYDKEYQSYQAEAAIYEAKLKGEDRPINSYDKNNEADKHGTPVDPRIRLEKEKQALKERQEYLEHKKEAEAAPWYSFDVQNVTDFEDGFIYGITHPVQNVKNISSNDYSSMDKWQKDRAQGKDESFLDIVTDNVKDVLKITTGIDLGDGNTLLFYGLLILGGSIVAIKFIKVV